MKNIWAYLLFLLWSFVAMISGCKIFTPEIIDTLFDISCVIRNAEIPNVIRDRICNVDPKYQTQAHETATLVRKEKRAYALDAGMFDAFPETPDVLPIPKSDAGNGEAGVITVYQAACSNLKHLGCSEGTPYNCEEVIEKVVISKITPMDAHCITNANTKTEVRKCGSIRCL